MSKELELCPICKKGNMRPTGKRDRIGEKPPSFNENKN